MPFDINIISLKDIIDILLVAFLLFKTYKLMKTSGSINVFIGILVFIVIWIIVSQVLQMRLLGSIFDKLVSVGVIALIIPRCHRGTREWGLSFSLITNKINELSSQN